MRYTKSMEYLERARKVTPGAAQTLSKFPCRFPIGAYPTALVRGDGAYVYDLDGNGYIDFICGLASMTLGYGNHRITREVLNQLHQGVTFSLANPRECFVAERICQTIPCAEMVRFVKTGSEATEAAIRVARRATGHNVVLTVGSGYHSWHSWFQAVKPDHPGVPGEYEDLAIPFVYNDLESLDAARAQAGNDTAAIILEPCHNEEPDEGFLEAVQGRARQWGAVLIFDEMVTGYRWADGGAQQYFGITPDLATFGKACANGYPLAFLCGRADLMHEADVISGTFSGEAMSLAACEAVLDFYATQPVVHTLWSHGVQLHEGIRMIAKTLSIPVVMDGYGCKPRMQFACLTADTNLKAMSLFLELTAAMGLLIHPAGFNLSYAMRQEDIEMALIKIGIALAGVDEAFCTGDWPFKGKRIQPAMGVRGA